MLSVLRGILFFFKPSVSKILLAILLFFATFLIQHVQNVQQYEKTTAQYDKLCLGRKIKPVDTTSPVIEMGELDSLCISLRESVESMDLEFLTIGNIIFSA